MWEPYLPVWDLCKLSLDFVWLQKWQHLYLLWSLRGCCINRRRRINHAHNKARTVRDTHLFFDDCDLALQFHSLSITAELIGQNCESAAFIYGAMSLTDKFANGLVVIAVQSMVPGLPEECNRCEGCSPFYSQVLFYVCGGATLLGALSMFSLVPFTIGHRLGKEDGTSP